MRLGDLDLDESSDDGATPVDMEVESSVSHPQYRTDQKVNDIAIIKMKGRVNFTSKITYFQLYTELNTQGLRLH